MSNDNRVNAGIPSGGQFSAHAKADGEIALTTPHYSAVANFWKSNEAFAEAETARLNAALLAIRESALADFPNAATAVLNRPEDQENQYLMFVHLLDAKGQEIDGSDDFDAMHDFVSVLGDHADAALLEIEGDPGGFTLNFDMLPDPSKPANVEEINAGIAAISGRTEEGEARMFVLAAAGTKILVQTEFPDAASVVLEDTNDEGGSPMFSVVAIQDSNGEDLWTDETSEEDAEFFSEYASMLDRDLSKLSKTTHVRADPINDAYRLTF